MIGWFLVPYARGTFLDDLPYRYCAMDDFTAQIVADGGRWAETEVLGNHAIVKVSASSTTLQTIAGTAGFTRIPARFLNLSQTLGDLTAGERNAILTRIQALGYSTAEISAALGSNLTGWRQRTLGDVLRFIASRRLGARYDLPTDTFVFDRPAEPVRPIEDVDVKVV